MNNWNVDEAGGQPIRLDDFRFLQDSVKSILTGLAKGMLDEKAYTVGATPYDHFVISGVKQTPSAGLLSFTAGYVYLDGEIYAVDAGSYVTTAMTDFFWTILETDDPAGTRTYQNTTSHETYKVRKATLQSGASGVPVGSFAIADVLFDINRAKGFTEVEAQFIDGTSTTAITPLTSNMKLITSVGSMNLITINNPGYLRELTFSIYPGFGSGFTINAATGGNGGNIRLAAGVSSHVEINAAIYTIYKFNWSVDVWELTSRTSIEILP